MVVVERSKLPIKLRDRLFEHAAMVGRAGQLKIRQRAGACKHQCGALALSIGIPDADYWTGVATV